MDDPEARAAAPAPAAPAPVAAERAGPEPAGPEPAAPEPATAPAFAVRPQHPYLPFAAYAMPAPPPPRNWTRTFDLPSARRVVSAGLQLAVDASAPIRRGSIYIGLLSLGAFGPAVVLLLLGLGRLMSDPATANLLQNDPSALFIEHPDLLGPLALIYALLAAGLVLLVSIGIDAQAIAISILAGRAADRPMQLWEAIVRARQVFWRLLGAGFLAGLASTVVTAVVVLPFLRPEDTNTGLSFIGSAIGALVVTPFAFASTSVVLGDVGAIEALRRSVQLFRARPRIAFVVTAFTLITSAIQSFAISAGADAATRVGTFLHLGFDEGGLVLVVLSILVLAFVVAFGSLTFTIAAIVAAPQVAAFLGLTYHTGGLDRARSTDGGRPGRFRWVTVPMALAMGGMLVVAGFGLPTVTGFQLQATGPVLTDLSSIAADHRAIASSRADQPAPSSSRRSSSMPR